jgi:hypothetical protein
MIPFAGREGHAINNVLPSGVSLDHAPQDAGHVTLSEMQHIQLNRATLLCFAYVDYTDGSPDGAVMKTSCCRQLEADWTGQAHATFRGAFVSGDRSDKSEHNYTDER